MQVASADDAATATRGMPLKRRSSPHIEGVSSADLAQLPRLPDTAAELIAIAKALGLDPAKVLHLGKEANEKAVETADLSHYRIIDFATHGLVPGELDGLTQPALALTAPAVAGVSGDGLADDGKDSRAQARRRLGRAVGLQHRGRRRAPARKPRRASARRSSMPARAPFW